VLDLREDIALRTQDSVTLKWTTPSDLGGAESVTYSVYQKFDDSEQSLLSEGLVSPVYTIPSLIAGQEYTFAVITVNDFAPTQY
jgi:hypothetical protein